MAILIAVAFFVSAVILAKHSLRPQPNDQILRNKFAIFLVLGILMITANILSHRSQPAIKQCNGWNYLNKC